MGTPTEPVSRRRPRATSTSPSSGSPSSITAAAAAMTSSKTNLQKTSNTHDKSKLPKSRLSSQPVALNDPALVCSVSFDHDDFPFAAEQSSASFTRQDVTDRLAVMRGQESTAAYAARDYLHSSSSTNAIDHSDDQEESIISSSDSCCSKENEHKQHHMTMDSFPNRMLHNIKRGLAKISDDSTAASSASTSSKTQSRRSSFSKAQHATDAMCREKMIIWSIQVLDYCNLNRQTAELAVRMLDRYLSLAVIDENDDQDHEQHHHHHHRHRHRHLAQSCLDNRKKYQLAAMTCLYSTIKVHETEVMSPDIVASLSRGMSTSAQVVEMEGHILHALGWRICGPTGTDVVDHLVQLLPATVPQHVKRVVIEKARYAIHQALLDYEVSTTLSPTVLGYAALVHALDGLDEWTRTQYIDRDSIVTDMTSVIFDSDDDADIDEDFIVWAIARLGEITTDENASGSTTCSSKSRISASSDTRTSTTKTSTTKSSSSSASGRPGRLSSSERKRRECFNDISPRTVVNQPASASVEVS